MSGHFAIMQNYMVNVTSLFKGAQIHAGNCHYVSFVMVCFFSIFVFVTCVEFNFKPELEVPIINAVLMLFDVA